MNIINVNNWKFLETIFHNVTCWTFAGKGSKAHLTSSLAPIL